MDDVFHSFFHEFSFFNFARKKLDRISHVTQLHFFCYLIGNLLVQRSEIVRRNYFLKGMFRRNISMMTDVSKYVLLYWIKLNSFGQHWCDIIYQASE